MAKPARTSRFSASALNALLETHPFPRHQWEEATSDTLHLRIGNGQPATNKAASLHLLAGFIGHTHGFFCGFCEQWAVNECIYIETEVAFFGADDEPDRIPCVVVARTTHGLIADLRFHLDPTPLGWTYDAVSVRH